MLAGAFLCLRSSQFVHYDGLMKTAFTEYLEAMGDEQAGIKHGVTTRTAQSWRLGQRGPSMKRVAHILANSPKRVTLESIVQARDFEKYPDPEPKKRVAS